MLPAWPVPAGACLFLLGDASLTPAVRSCRGGLAQWRGHSGRLRPSRRFSVAGFLLRSPASPGGVPLLLPAIRLATPNPAGTTIHRLNPKRAGPCPGCGGTGPKRKNRSKAAGRPWNGDSRETQNSHLTRVYMNPPLKPKGENWLYLLPTPAAASGFTSGVWSRMFCTPAISVMFLPSL